MIIEEILDARDECVMMKITGEKVRFNRLRSLCKKYNEYEDEKVFDLSADDSAFWRQVNQYLTQRSGLCSHHRR